MNKLQIDKKLLEEKIKEYETFLDNVWRLKRSGITYDKQAEMLWVHRVLFNAYINTQNRKKETIPSLQRLREFNLILNKNWFYFWFS